MPRIAVLMTTYNGEKFLREQLDSILQQKDVEVTLFVADDCSKDSTCKILNEYAAKNSNIKLSFNKENKGCVCNFMDLIYSADTKKFEYFAISDQDVIWLPNKLLVAASAL